MRVREILLRDKPQTMLDISHRGTLPALLFADGSVLEESLDIMLWAFTQSDVQAWLHPQDGELDDMLDVIEHNDTDFKHHLDRYKYPDRYTEEHADALAHRAQACDFLTTLEQLLNANNFLFGPHPSLADIAISPFVRQFAATDRKCFAPLESPRLHA